MLTSLSGQKEDLFVMIQFVTDKTLFCLICRHG